VTDIAAIRAAAGRASADIRVTPLLSADALDRIAGRRVLVKAECLQVTGSFKARGGWAAVSALTPEIRARGVVGMSSGNHAQGLAWAAAAHGVPATIVMPSDTPPGKIVGTEALGAEVVRYDRETGDREAIAAAVAAERGASLIPPFDHPEVIAGQGTAGLELAAQAAEAGVTAADVLTCCGGGGLAAGMALAFEAVAPGLRVRTVEPVGFDDMARSLRAGEFLANPAATGSVCDASLTREPGQLTFPVLARLAGPGLVVSDAEAMEAVALAFRHLRVVLEPGGAVALAAALFRPAAIEEPVVIAVATGGNVDAGRFATAIGA
jgi:threonine dehydratase